MISFTRQAISDSLAQVACSLLQQVVCQGSYAIRGLLRPGLRSGCVLFRRSSRVRASHSRILVALRRFGSAGALMNHGHHAGLRDSVSSSTAPKACEVSLAPALHNVLEGGGHD